MKKNQEDQIVFSATDLANHLGCTHATQLERQFVAGTIEPEYHHDPLIELLIELGQRHEAEYLEYLKQSGKSIVQLKEFDASSHEKTIEAMRAGVDVISQGWLETLPWRGRCDFLLKVDRPSDLGGWSYEVADTKLARETRATTILQLCLYSELVGNIQGVTPAMMHIVKPRSADTDSFETESLRVADFAAYFRMAKSGFEQSMNEDTDSNSYPDPCDHCEVCKWWPTCNQVWRDDDHLSFIAGITKSQRTEIVDQGLTALTAFAEADQPLNDHPKRGAMDSYRKVHRQAKIQLKGKQSGKPEYEFNQIEEKRGFLSLPEPSDSDLFFDIEGNPRATGQGLEYLFGFVNCDGDYTGNWALDKRNEKRCFEEFIDFVLDRWKTCPEMHIYHFAPYEPSALKRLALKHATREFELDDLLRAELFVDLYAITKQAIRASVESYSIKQLEQFYGFVRSADLNDAGNALRAVERLIEFDLTKDIKDSQKAIVEDYNRDDCQSTLALRRWLEEKRTELQDTGVELTRPPLGDPQATESVEEMSAEAKRVFELLTFDIHETPVNDDQRVRWQLAHMLEYFRRESKCKWWEFFRLRDLEHDELLQENQAISGLKYIDEIPGPKASSPPIHRYCYPEQETTLREGDQLFSVDGKPLGSVDHINLAERIVGIKKRKDTTDIHQNSAFAFLYIDPRSMPRSLFALGEDLALAAQNAQVIESARYDLLCQNPPRFRTLSLPQFGDPAKTAIELAEDLDNSYLAIQGPPGTGKTYVGSQMIHSLARSGCKVGVCAVSHSVILNLLAEIEKRNTESGKVVRLAHKPKSKKDLPSFVDHISNGYAAIDAINSGVVVGGTAWLWSSGEMEQQLDYLFIDEAGQVSLAMALAAGRAARNIVLLGDPQQLEQPQQALHPEGSGVAALAHILDGKDTIADDRGMFLDTTWRLHPTICEFTSEQYYDNRVVSLDGLENQAIIGAALPGQGLRFLPVLHEGNQNRSFEEVDAINSLLEQLVDGQHLWANKELDRATITLNEVLIVAPYNAQVSALQKALPDGARIGTVDKFQGQEAPIVIYSMTSSSADVAPHGLTFLFNRNRTNVATSRARCIVVLVGSPNLVRATCSTPEQMRLANGVCRYFELAQVHPTQGEDKTLGT